MTHDTPIRAPTLGPRCLRNRRIRSMVFDMVDVMEPGKTVTSNSIAAVLETGRRFIDARTIGGFLREREDLRSLGNGVWLKTAQRGPAIPPQEENGDDRV